MKTLLVTTEFPPFKGGVANYYGQLAGYWPLPESLLILHNNNGELVKEHGFWAWQPAIRTMSRKIRKNRIAYVLVGQILPLGTVAWLLSFFQSFKYAVFLHGMDLNCALKSLRKKILTALILRRSDQIICANNYVLQQVRKFYPGATDKTVLVNPGVPAFAPPVSPQDLIDLQNRYDLAGKIVLFSLGRLVTRKGVDQTIKALTEIPAPLSDKLRYFIAGTGPQDEYLRNLCPPEIADKIIFLGELTDKDKWTWLKQCAIFIMPARDIAGDFEGFGIVYLEANLSGKPVIAGQAGGVSDAVIDGFNGLLVNPEDSGSIREAIVKLASDPNLRDRLGEQGRERASREFNWENQTAKLINIITDSF